MKNRRGEKQPQVSGGSKRGGHIKRSSGSGRWMLSPSADPDTSGSSNSLQRSTVGLDEPDTTPVSCTCTPHTAPLVAGSRSATGRMGDILQ